MLLDLSTQAIKSSEDFNFMMLLINHVLLISKDILKKETDIEYQNIVDEIIGIYSS